MQRGFHTMALKLAIKKKKKCRHLQDQPQHTWAYTESPAAAMFPRTQETEANISFKWNTFNNTFSVPGGFPGGSVVKNPPAMQKIWLHPLVQEDALEKGMATLSLLVFFPGKSHGQKSLEGYSPWGRKRVGHDLVTKQQQHVYTCMYIWIYTQKIKAGPKKPNIKDFCPQNSWLVLYSLQFPAGLVKVSTSTSEALILCSTYYTFLLN